MFRISAENQGRMVALSSTGFNQSQLAQLAGCSRASVRNILAFHSENGLVPALTIGEVVPGGLVLVELEFVREMMKTHPGAYLDEYCAALSSHFQCPPYSTSTMCRVLQHLDASYKVMYRKSAQADPFLEGYFLTSVAHIPRGEIVWLDEMGTCNNDVAHRRRGHAAVGERAIDRGLFFGREHYSCLAAMSTEGVVGHQTVRGSINSERLLYYVQIDLLDKMWRLGKKYLVLDNCSIHKSEEFLHMCQQAGVCVRFLPPYSPWLNPIEAVFRNSKAFLRRHFHAMMADGLGMPMMLAFALASITADTCQSFITDAGYL